MFECPLGISVQVNTFGGLVDFPFLCRTAGKISADCRHFFISFKFFNSINLIITFLITYNLDHRAIKGLISEEAQVDDCCSCCCSNFLTYSSSTAGRLILIPNAVVCSAFFCLAMEVGAFTFFWVEGVKKIIVTGRKLQKI